MMSGPDVSKYAKTARYVAYVPLLGIPLYLFFSFFSLLDFNKGRAGYHLLRRGFVVFFINVLLVGGYYFYPRYTFHQLGPAGPAIFGYERRNISGGITRFGKWYFDKEQLLFAGEYDWNGKKIRFWRDPHRIAFFSSGEYKDGKREGKWETFEIEGHFKDFNKQLSNNKFIKKYETHYHEGVPCPSQKTDP